MSLTIEVLEQHTHESKLDLSNTLIDDRKYFIRDSDVDLLLEYLDAHLEITSLNLNHNYLKADGFKALALNNTLTSIDLWLSFYISDEAVSYLAANTTWKELRLGNETTHGKIGDEGFKALAANTTLSKLTLSYLSMSIEATEAIAANTNLTTLHIEFCELDDDGAIALAANRTLRELKLEHNNFSTVGVNAFLNNFTLDVLRLTHNYAGNDSYENVLHVELEQSIKQKRLANKMAFTHKLVRTLFEANTFSPEDSGFAWLPLDLAKSIINLAAGYKIDDDEINTIWGYYERKYFFKNPARLFKALDTPVTVNASGDMKSEAGTDAEDAVEVSFSVRNSPTFFGPAPSSLTSRARNFIKACTGFKLNPS